MWEDIFMSRSFLYMVTTEQRSEKKDIERIKKETGNQTIMCLTL